MLVVEFDPGRPREEGQFHVRLIDAASGDYGNDAKRQSQIGYWCDIGHLRSGVLAPVEAAVCRAERLMIEPEPRKGCGACNGDGWMHSGIGGRTACSHCDAGLRWHGGNPRAGFCCGRSITDVDPF